MTEGPGSVKTLAIRLPDDLRAQLDLIAQLDGTSLNALINRAAEELVERRRAQGDLASRAQAAMDEIEREAAARRVAIQALLGEPTAEAPQATTPEGGPQVQARPRRGRGPRP